MFITRFTKLYAALLLPLILSTQLIAGELNIERLSILPRNDVSYTYEDRMGFVWIATLDGLYRYDGHECRVYLPDGKEGSISSSMILVINEDSRGNLWLGTYGRGLSRYSPRSGKFRNYSLQDIYGDNNHYHDIISIAIDRNNAIWIGTVRGFGRLLIDPESGDIIQYDDYTYSIMSDDQESDPDPNTIIHKIHKDKSGNIWVGSSNCVMRIVEVLESELITEKYDIAGFDICDFTPNSIIVGGHGINTLKMDMESGSYNIDEQLSRYRTEIIHYNHGSIWSGNRTGLRHLTKNNDGQWQLTQSFSARDNSVVESNIITSLMSDKLDQLWVSTRGGGLYIVDKKDKPFYNYPISDSHNAITRGIKKAIYEDSHGNLWVGSEGQGIDFIAAGKDYITGNRRIEINAEDDRIYTFAESGADGDGRNLMWVGVPAPHFLMAIDIETLNIVKQSPLIPRLGFIFTIAQTDSSTLWAGSYNNGLWRLTIDEQGQIVKWRHFMAQHSDPKSGLNSNTIRNLFVDSRGDLWINTDVGTNRIDRDDLLSDTPIFNKRLSNRSRFTLNGHYTLESIESSAGEIYIGTMGSGMVRYNPRTDKLTFIDRQSGLSNNTVKSLIEDRSSGAIWIATNDGLSKYTPQTGAIINYGREHGINDVEFAEICGVMRSNGMIVFGNRHGIVEFDPLKIPTSKVTPTLLFTDLIVNNRRVEVGADDGILSRSIELTNSIELDYDQRNFTISFVGINLASPMGSRYRYRLHGFDNEWRLCSGDKRTASYTNMPAGKYTFSVQASNADDVWSERVLTLNIVVHPPLYLSGIAYLLYVLLIIVAGFLIFWVTRLRYLKRRDVDIARIEQRRVEELMQYKLDFFMNVSHEFRTPLTLITLPLERSKEEAQRIDNSIISESLDLIGRNVSVLKKLINEVLDFRKVEDGKQPIHVEASDMGSFVKLYCDLFTLNAELHNIKFKFTQPRERAIVDLDKRLFEKVMINLLSNAFRHTPDNGQIEVSIIIDHDYNLTIISVCDNGCGVDSDSLQHIFDQFYQAENTTKGGSGIGLSLCKGIVELHGGILRAESEVGSGFSAIIELPLSNGEISEDVEYSIIDEESIKAYSLSETPDIESEVEVEVEKVQSEEQVPIANSVNRARVLIVEDNDDLRQELVATLSRDYDMVEAQNGEQGVEMCRKHYPDLVITDIMMPVMDGIEMCRIIKSDEDISHTPIMVLTANSSIKSQIDSFTIGGAEGYLDKPFDITVLRSHVKAILHNRSILRDRFQRQAIITPDALAQTPADVKFLSQIIAIIKDDIGNSELNVEMIAQRYGVSRTYLNRKIKALTGDTSIIFLRRIRLKYAASLLTQGELNVNEIAWEVGYNDINTFRLRFKEMYGVSPTNYKGE
ncbi:MAG: two-component regulator propeller domain-containing protein [Rikenellaceae bacterium]